SISVKPFSFFIPGVWRSAVNMTSIGLSFCEALSAALGGLQRVARFLDSASGNGIKAKKNRR
ncbi:hypothetical protein, partial [Enterobacter asburiae]